MNLFNSLVRSYLKTRIKKIEHFKKHPVLTQERLLFDLIQKSKNTTYGKDLGFHNISSISEFKQQIPINDYESLKPYIQRNIEGEQNILWSTDISWFAKSSGTTNDKSKFIPISSESLSKCHIKGPKDLMSIYVYNNPNTTVFNGKSLIMGGSHKTHEQHPSTKLGDVSAVMMKNQPFLANILRAPNSAIAFMDNWEEKIDKIAKATIDKNITNIGGVPTWTIVLMNHILDLTKKSCIKDIWPNLELYMHGGVNFEPYRASFQKLIGGEILYYQTYNASEGFFAFQDENNADDMLLALDNGVYYEFIDMDQLDELHPKNTNLEDVELYKNYAIVITTNSGLWRYKVGDTVQFTSKFPFKIKVTGRTKHFINAFGEEIIIENADKAIEIACNKHHAVLKEYTAAPKYFSGNEKAYHQWLIEFTTPPNDIEHFLDTLDLTLQSINSDYEAKRQNNMALKKPEIIAAPKGLFYRWLKSKNKLGGQYKVPRLSNDRKHMEELLSEIKKHT